MKIMKSKIMWFLVGLVAAWILLLPFICRAEGPRPWTQGEKTVVAWQGLAR